MRSPTKEEPRRDRGAVLLPEKAVDGLHPSIGVVKNGGKSVNLLAIRDSARLTALCRQACLKSIRGSALPMSAVPIV
jgi:hypothetical protein